MTARIKTLGQIAADLTVTLSIYLYGFAEVAVGRLRKIGDGR